MEILNRNNYSQTRNHVLGPPFMLLNNMIC